MQNKKKDDITSNGSAGWKDNREMATWMSARNTEESDESIVVVGGSPIRELQGDFGCFVHGLTRQARKD
jgi:hypothetical protein